MLQMLSQLDSFGNSDHEPEKEDPVFEEIHRTSSNPNGEMLLDPRKIYITETSID